MQFKNQNCPLVQLCTITEPLFPAKQIVQRLQKGLISVFVTRAPWDGGGAWVSTQGTGAVCCSALLLDSPNETETVTVLFSQRSFTLLILSDLNW